MMPNLARRFTIALFCVLCVTTAVADIAVLDTADPNNGIFDIYSATFDPPLNPVGDPFFFGTPPASRAITLVPNPTGLRAGAQLDLTLSANNTMVTIAGGDAPLPDLDVVINAGTAQETVVKATNANPTMTPVEFIVFAAALTPSEGTTTVDGNGVAVFEVDNAPALAADFSTFALIVPDTNDGMAGDIPDGQPGSCTGPLCGLVPILTLDMLRYRLTIDFAPDFSSFTAAFVGQTANNSMVFATLNGTFPEPEIAVTDSVAPANDLDVPFGSVALLSAPTQTVTVTNNGTANLNVGTLGASDALAAPFALSNDMCSGQALAPAASCNVTVTFTPTVVGPFSDSFDIPSDDADEASVTVTLSGTGTALPVPNIDVTDSVAPADDLSIPFGSVTINQSATPATVTVTNSGSADLVLGQIAPLTAPLAIAGDNCSNATVMPAMSCTLMVTFMPTAVGDFNDVLNVPSDDPDSPNISVAISGIGAPEPTPDINVMDVNVTFGAVTVNSSTTQTVVVANDGAADLTIATVGMADPLAAPYSIDMDTCSGQTLTPTASCMIDVSFAPAATGPANDSLDIPSDDPDEASVTVNVSGIGADPTVLEAVPTSPSGSDSGFFGASFDPLSLVALLSLLTLYRIRFRQLSRC